MCLIHIYPSIQNILLPFLRFWFINEKMSLSSFEKGYYKMAKLHYIGFIITTHKSYFFAEVYTSIYWTLLLLHILP